MRALLPSISCFACLTLSSFFIIVNASANTPLSDQPGQAANAQPLTSTKRVTIHLESYADAKSAAAAQKMAAFIETRLPKGSIDHSRHVDKSTARPASATKGSAKTAMD